MSQKINPSTFAFKNESYDILKRKAEVLGDSGKAHAAKRSRSSIGEVEAPLTSVTVVSEQRTLKLELPQSLSAGLLTSSDLPKRETLGEVPPKKKRSRSIVIEVKAPLSSVSVTPKKGAFKLELSQSQSMDPPPTPTPERRKRKADVLNEEEKEEEKARPEKKPRVDRPLIPAESSSSKDGEIKSEESQVLPFPVVPVAVLSELDEKLFRTFKKALKENGLEESQLPDFSMKIQDEPFLISFRSLALQGIRSRMEDAHFHCEIEGGSLFGIFDGHSDRGKMAAMASREVQQQVPRLLKEYPLERKRVFREVCASIHKKITQPLGGTTALICHVDAQNRLTTARVGDTKAIVIRKVGEGFVWFPMTRDRNWKHPKSEARAFEAYPELVNLWHSEDEKIRLKYDDPKNRRCPPEIGINTDGSLGDIDIKGLKRDPDVTLFQLEEGDLIFGGCDGIFDFASPQELIDQVISQNWEKKGLLQAVADYILKDKKGSDNLTAVCGLVRRRSDPVEESSSCESTESYEKESD